MKGKITSSKIISKKKRETLAKNQEDSDEGKRADVGNKTMQK